LHFLLPEYAYLLVVKATFLILIGLAVNTLMLPAQNLNGFWKGTLTMRGCFGENNIELQLHVNGDQLTGDSYHYQNVYNYVKKKIKGYYNRELNKLVVDETIVTTHLIPPHCVICIKTFELAYSKSENVEMLSGIWYGNVMHSGADCLGGTITLSRIAESAFKEIPEIKVDTGTLRLDFYDNGVVDGDTISIRVNKKIVLAHQLLSEKPITFFITVDLKNTFHEVEMIAENLGSIPPNTALLIITAGRNQYRLYFESTKTKSAMVRILYDPDINRQANML
jgi:hypothetical protein